MRFDDPIKKCVKLTSKLLTYAYKQKVVKFKLDDYPLHCQVYLLSFTNSIKIVLSTFSETYMLPMDYPFIRGE